MILKLRWYEPFVCVHTDFMMYDYTYRDILDLTRDAGYYERAGELARNIWF